MDTELLDRLATYGSCEAGIGGALITLVGPKPGLEDTYNRWYEDDHYISGALAWPWVFAGRRWMATRRLFATHAPDDSTLVPEALHSAFAHLYWIATEHVDDVEYFATVSVSELAKQGRMSADRVHIYTHFQDYHGAAYRDADGPRDIHALNHPYRGMVLEVIDAPDADQRRDLQKWYLSERAPAVLARGSAAMCLLFSPRPHPANMPADIVASVPPINPGRLTALWFLDDDPGTAVETLFHDEAETVAAAGLGDVQLIISSRPGRDRDERADRRDALKHGSCVLGYPKSSGDEHARSPQRRRATGPCQAR
ncbi:hypothetical protein ACHMWU_11330 [Aeromicrobium sp. UC242_57]